MENERLRKWRWVNDMEEEVLVEEVVIKKRDVILFKAALNEGAHGSMQLVGLRDYEDHWNFRLFFFYIVS